MSNLRRTTGNLVRHACLAVCVLSAPAFAAEVYYQPTAVLTAENDTNLDLSPGGSAGNVQGYLANVGTLIGIATQDSDSAIRPRLDYRDYPKETGDDRLEEYLDFRSAYRWQRSSASISGAFDRQDDFNAEFSSALYSDFNPVQQPTAPETGKAVVGLTRTSLLVQPRYDYKFTPTLGAGVSAIYQNLTYSPSDTVDHVDFDYYQGTAFLTWSLSSRTDMQFGGFGSKYDASQARESATGAGTTATLSTAWTPLFSTSAQAVYQHTNFDATLPAVPPAPAMRSTANDNAWGATVSAAYKAQISQLRMNVGRIITPSGAGGIYVNDQLQVQYSRNFSERLLVTGAVIYLRNHGLEAPVADYDRDYLQTVVEAKWMIRPTWFVQGGYQYAWQKYKNDPDGAVNNRIYLRIGYQGLGRQY